MERLLDFATKQRKANPDYACSKAGVCSIIANQSYILFYLTGPESIKTDWNESFSYPTNKH